jgi:hypothetical protein
MLSGRLPGPSLGEVGEVGGEALGVDGRRIELVVSPAMRKYEASQHHAALDFLFSDNHQGRLPHGLMPGYEVFYRPPASN